MTVDAAPSAPGQSFPCTNCGAQAVFDAGAQALRCPFCGHTSPLPIAQGPRPHQQEIPLEQGLAMAAKGFGTPVTQVSCNDCGATVNVTAGEQTVKCAFCGSHQVLAREAAGTIIRPESMIPFRMDKAAANARFGVWLKGLWFRPNDLKHLAQVQEMGGVYIPYWTFDAHVDSRWTAEAGYHYYVSETYTDGQGQQRSRQVQKTRWEHTSGARHDSYDDVLVCASKGLPESLVEQFTTFQTRELVAYDPAMLAGWKAESYALDLMPGWSKAEKKMEEGQRSKCSRDVPGDTQRNLWVQNQFSHRTFKHVLLPIWIAAYRYKDKPFQFLVNGQTGEVVGKAPWSFWKIFLTCLLAAALITGGLYLYDKYRKKPAPAPVPAMEAAPAEAAYAEPTATAAPVTAKPATAKPTTAKPKPTTAKPLPTTTATATPKPTTAAPTTPKVAPK